jgi:hypothetical protein
VEYVLFLQYILKMIPLKKQFVLSVR